MSFRHAFNRMLFQCNKRSISPVSRLGRITHTTSLRLCDFYEKPDCYKKMIYQSRKTHRTEPQTAKNARPEPELSGPIGCPGFLDEHDRAIL